MTEVAYLCSRCKGQGALLMHADGREEPLPGGHLYPEAGSYGIVCPECQGFARTPPPEEDVTR